MILRRNPGQSRKAVTVVEMAVVCVMFFTMLFGIFEYCRFLLVLHVSNNAARDAARYLSVKTNGGNMPGDPNSPASLADLQSLVLSGTIGSQNPTSGMSQLEKNIENLTVSVFTVDPDGLNQTPPVIKPLMNGSTQAAWNSAGFSQKIAVRLSGNYRPVATGLLFLPSTIPFQVTVLVGSEAN